MRSTTATALEALRLLPGLTPAAHLYQPRRRLSANVPAVDALLGGGVPCGAVTEVFGTLSSGRTALAHACVAAARASGEWTAWVDLPNAFTPPDRLGGVAPPGPLLWIQPPDPRTAVRVAEHVLELKAFRVLVLDLDDRRSNGAFATTTWLRLARAAMLAPAAVLVLSATHIVGSFAAVSLEAVPGGRLFAGQGTPAPMFDGLASAVHLRANKFGPLADRPPELRWAR